MRMRGTVSVGSRRVSALPIVRLTDMSVDNRDNRMIIGIIC
jgi:hypothetical protein